MKRGFLIGLTLVTLGLTLYSYKLDKAVEQSKQKVKQEPYTTVIVGTDTVKIDTNFNIIK